MVQPPAVVIVARHGARLDAADKKWHLTSPTPYDPPLTYGGWTQSRALGGRIASVLQARDTIHSETTKSHSPSFSGLIEDVRASGVNGDSDPDSRHERNSRRKYRIVIHTSPFLRCIQTSIAISAGMSQVHGSSQTGGSSSTSRSTHPHSGSPHLHATDSAMSPRLSAIPEPGESSMSDVTEKAHKPKESKKPIIRVDAFLGEWLSPDYFDLIAPPPSSVLMVAGAKADLLRRGEAIDSSHEATTTARPSQGNFPGGWNSGWGGFSPSGDSSDEAPLSSLSSIGHALPRRDRRGSQSSTAGSSGKSSRNNTNKLNTTINSEQGGYTSPSPTYAVSTSDPIPRGYVTHARDACVDVDFQWDSMREPQNWGNGGEYGEEWSSMHKRFRRGLQNMVEWYRDHGLAMTKTQEASAADEEACESEEGDDDSIDTILIVVTHGAGCNALIGALTNQPVLLDVGMASLTMAVRKDVMNGINSSTTADNQPSPRKSPPPRRQSSVNMTLSDEYEVKLTASTEHLRARSNSLIPQLQSPRTSISHVSTYRQRYSSAAMSSSPIDDNFSLGEPSARSMTHGGFGGLHRASTLANPSTRSRITASRKGSLGLWNPTLATESPTDETPSGEDVVLNFGSHGKPSEKLDSRGEEEKIQGNEIKSEATNVGIENGRDTKKVGNVDGSLDGNVSPRGLWGGSPRGSLSENGPKRRWTVTQHPLSRE
ncbi:MAG: hypothetical protein M1827_007537 [Pycnora praestabilis]|nr:MAG: hypothetical protein M1827_007537 [Pycnora praestabilis]